MTIRTNNLIKKKEFSVGIRFSTALKNSFYVSIGFGVAEMTFCHSWKEKLK